MKIWIDGYEANVPNRVGSGQYAFELLRNLEIIDHKNEYLILLPSAPLSDLPKTREGWKYKVLKPKRFWTRIALPLALFTRQKPDLFFSPTHYIPRFSPVKVVVSIFDLAYFHFPEFFKKSDLYKLSNWTKYSIENAAAIITISKSTKKDLIKFYKLKADKITVTYPGFKSGVYHPLKDKKEIGKITKKYKIGDSYIIYIGTIQPRKNLARLIEAFARVARNVGDLNLVIVGKTTGVGRQGWMFEDILSLPKKLEIEDRVIFTGFVPDEDLNFLLNGAEAFILPSLYEGFGIPVVDSMAAGVPVVISNIASLKEAAGKAALLVDPYSVDQIEQAIRTITIDKSLRQKYSKLGLSQAKKFSWKKMAKETLKVFEKVA
mgnify:CR=1 FL=1